MFFGVGAGKRIRLESFEPSRRPYRGDQRTLTPHARGRGNLIVNSVSAPSRTLPRRIESLSSSGSVSRKRKRRSAFAERLESEIFAELA